MSNVKIQMPKECKMAKWNSEMDQNDTPVMPNQVLNLALK